MNLVQLLKHLNTKTVRTNYFIFGEDAYQRYFAEQKVLIKFSDPGITFVKFVFDGNFDRWSSVVDSFSEDFFLEDRRIVIVRNYDLFKDKTKNLDTVFNQKDASRVVIVSVSYRKHPQEMEKFSSFVGEVNCKYFAEYQDSLKEFIDIESSYLELKLSEEFKLMLVEICGSDLMSLMNFLSQLHLFKDSKLIDEEFFKEAIKANKNYTIFDLVTVVCHRNLDKSIKILKALFETRFSFASFLRLLDKQLRMLYKAIRLKSQNISAMEMASSLGVNRFFITGILNQTKKWDDQRFEKAYRVISSGLRRKNHDFYSSLRILESLTR